MFNEFHYQVRGRGHHADGTLGQDRTDYLKSDGVQVLCLADGAGSATHSAFGAQAVTYAGCALLAQRFHDFASGEDAAGAREEIVAVLQARLEETADRLGCAVTDLASTFLAVALSEDRFVIAHIGDGVIGYMKHGELKVASTPDNSEFANETTFVTSGSAAASLRLFRGSLEDVSGFILMSDGTSASLFDQRTKSFAPACAKLISMVAEAPTRQTANPAHKKALKRVVDTQIRAATKDDCSVGIFGRRPEIAPT